MLNSVVPTGIFAAIDGAVVPREMRAAFELATIGISFRGALARIMMNVDVLRIFWNANGLSLRQGPVLAGRGGDVERPRRLPGAGTSRG